MVTEHRSRILGDFGPSDPSLWTWGGPSNPDVHLLVVVYAADEPALAAASTEHVGPAGRARDPAGRRPDRRLCQRRSRALRVRRRVVTAVDQGLAAPHRLCAPAGAGAAGQVGRGRAGGGRPRLQRQLRPAGRGSDGQGGADRRSTAARRPVGQGPPPPRPRRELPRVPPAGPGRRRASAGSWPAPARPAQRGDSGSAPKQVGAKMVGRWASGASLAAVARRRSGRPRHQRLRVPRPRPGRVRLPARRPRPPGQPARLHHRRPSGEGAGVDQDPPHPAPGPALRAAAGRPTVPAG